MSKRILIPALIFVLYAGRLFAANCTISGQVLNIDNTACANCTITFNPVTQQPLTTGGTAYTSQPVSTTTDSSGNMTAISLPQGLIVHVTISESGATFGGYDAIVPFMSSATFVQMNQGISTQSLDALASSQPPTGPLSMNNQKITNLACPTTGGNALAWGCDATLGNVTITGSITQNTSGLALHGLLTDTQITDPSAPTSVTAVGVTGSTSYYYFVVCHDGNGGTTLASAGTNVANSNATLSVSNYNQVAWTFPTHAINCDILRNTSNTTTGAQSCTNGLAVTSSPFNDQSNTTAAYTIPTRNTTGDGQFAGAVTAGTVPSGIATGDLSTAESATTGKIWFGSNGSQALDYGVTKAGRWFLGGGPLELGADGNGVSPTNGDLTLAHAGGNSGVIYWGTGGASAHQTLDLGVQNAGAFTFYDFAFPATSTTVDIGGANANEAGNLNLLRGGTLTIKGASSGSAGISVAAAAGTPTTLKLPTSDGVANSLLVNDGSANLSWSAPPLGVAVGGTGTTTGGTWILSPGCSSNTTFTYTANKVGYILVGLQGPVTISHIAFSVTTSDASGADFYDVGIYNMSGTLLTHVGAANYTSTGIKTASLTGAPVTLTAGTYAIAITGNSTTAVINACAGASNAIVNFGGVNGTTDASSGGALPNSITAPTIATGFALNYIPDFVFY